MSDFEMKSDTASFSELLEPDTTERVVYRRFIHFSIDFGCTDARMTEDVLNGGQR